jgi:hypothetical protein
MIRQKLDAKESSLGSNFQNMIGPRIERQRAWIMRTAGSQLCFGAAASVFFFGKSKPFYKNHPAIPKNATP